MGLDQYASAVKGDLKLRTVKDAYGEDCQREAYEENLELAYWRKHSALQGWMEELYHKKGGQDEFNCVDVDVTENDLDELEDAVVHGTLPPTAGFFFGNVHQLEYKNEDLEFIRVARKHIADGYKILYSSWW